MSPQRGRPPEVVHRQPGQGLPVGHRPEDLQPTTRAILQAAHRLLVAKGVPAVTMAGVAREAHVDVTTVSYHFHTRDGLIEALMDFLYAEPVADLMDSAPEIPAVRDRWHAYLQAIRRMYGSRRGTATAADTQAYFDIAAHALRTPSLRDRLARLQHWKVEAFLRELDAPQSATMPALGEFIFAAIDGIELHQAIAGDDFPTDEVLRLLEQMVISLLGLSLEQAGTATQVKP